MLRYFIKHPELESVCDITLSYAVCCVWYVQFLRFRCAAKTTAHVNMRASISTSGRRFLRTLPDALRGVIVSMETLVVIPHVPRCRTLRLQTCLVSPTKPFSATCQEMTVVPTGSAHICSIQVRSTHSNQ
jgi:hypothetical protein